jgi:DNA-directed RNA polymerase specialized sigma24 family protein
LLTGDLNATEYTSALDLRQALDSLPRHLRLIVALRYFGNMDATEIGLFLHLAPVTVRARLRRALVLLCTALRVTEDLPLMSTPEEES